MNARFKWVALLTALCFFYAHSVQAACTSPTGASGQMLYNDASSVLQFCDGIQWEPMTAVTGTSGASCTVGQKGSLFYNDASSVLQFCNGANWIGLGLTPGTGGSGCSNPTAIKGALIYNADYKALQYCDGTSWRANRAGVPSTLDLDFLNNNYMLNGTSYSTVATFLTAAGGTFTRSTTATYFDNTGTLQSAATNTPRVDYDPISLRPKGLLMEESRTNSISNNTMTGAAAGTPGTLPNTWDYGPASGVTFQVVGTGTDHGISYIDFRIYGTPTASDFTNITFVDGVGATISASNGQAWTTSVYFAVLSGSLGSAGAYLHCAMQDGGGYEGEIINLDISSATSKLTRYAATGTINVPTTTWIQPYVQFWVTSGVPVDYTIRIGMPQAELGTFATSVIPTSSAAVTRAADQLNLPLPGTGNWFDSTKGTFITNAETFDPTAKSGTTKRYVWMAGTDSGNNQFLVRATNTAAVNAPQAAIGDGTSSVNLAPASNTNTVQYNKIALAYSSATSPGAGLSVNGATTVTLAKAAAPVTAGGLYIGSGGATGQIGGYISHFTYIPVREPNANLPDYSR